MDISLNATTPFNKFREFRTTTKGEGFTQKMVVQNPMRSFRLSVTYRFGDLKSSVKRVQRSISNEDLMQGESSQESGSSGSM